jgi:ribosomal protein S27AE
MLDNLSDKCNFNDEIACPKCGSLNTIRWTGKDEPTFHYGRLTCGDCGRFIKWLKDPGKHFNKISRINAIDEILENHKNEITLWEHGFLWSIKESKHLTQKQKECLNGIGLKYLHMAICAIE